MRENDPAPPAATNSKVPRDLDGIALKCLDKEPGRRYPATAALADDLDRFLRREPVWAKPIGPARGGPYGLPPVPGGPGGHRRPGRPDRHRPRRPELGTGAVARATGTAQAERLRLAREGEDRQRFCAGLERVRQRRNDPYGAWPRETLADLRALAVLPAAGENLPDLRTEAAAAPADTHFVPGPLPANFPAYAFHFSADGLWLAVAGWKAYDRGRVVLTDRRTAARRDLAFPVDAAWRARERKPAGASGSPRTAAGWWSAPKAGRSSGGTWVARTPGRADALRCGECVGCGDRRVRARLAAVQRFR